MKARSEDRPLYAVTTTAPRPDADEDTTIAAALAILARRLRTPGAALTTPTSVKDYLTLHLAQEEKEVFSILWMDSQNRVIAHDDLFFGTLTQTSVYPREVVKRALAHNAGAAILSHNHPSGFCDPSLADQAITRELKTALGYVDVRVLDHIIVAGTSTMSFAERGLI